MARRHSSGDEFCATGQAYIWTDHLNTPREITNSANQSLWRWDSLPFGDTPPNENPSGQGTYTFNLRFPGQYYDVETGLYHNGARDYDPASGRYVESDPIGLRGGLNTYAYAGGNPISASDNTGTLSNCEIQWLNAHYGEVGGFLVDFLSIQSMFEGSPAERSQAVLDKIKDELAHGGFPKLMAFVGQSCFRVAQNLSQRNISYGTAAAGAAVAEVAEAILLPLTATATVVMQVAINSCVGSD